MNNPVIRFFAHGTALRAVHRASLDLAPGVGVDAAISDYRVCALAARAQAMADAVAAGWTVSEVARAATSTADVAVTAEAVTHQVALVRGSTPAEASLRCLRAAAWCVAQGWRVDDARFINEAIAAGVSKAEIALATRAAAS